MWECQSSAWLDCYEKGRSLLYSNHDEEQSLPSRYQRGSRRRRNKKRGYCCKGNTDEEIDNFTLGLDDM